MSMPIKHRAAVLSTVVLFHAALGWLLLSRSQNVTTPVLDMPPVNVALIQAASFVSAPLPAPQAPKATKRNPTTPKPVAPQTLQTPASGPTPASTTSATAPTPDLASAAAAITPAPSSAVATTAPPSNKPSNTGSAAGTGDAAASLVSGSCAKPQYPMASRRMEEEGTVTLRFLVQADGQVSQSEVLNSSGFKRLDEAARAALSRCRFSPALTQGQATASWATIRYTWRLE